MPEFFLTARKQQLSGMPQRTVGFIPCFVTQNSNAQEVIDRMGQVYDEEGEKMFYSPPRLTADGTEDSRCVSYDPLVSRICVAVLRYFANCPVDPCYCIIGALRDRTDRFIQADTLVIAEYNS